MIFKNILIAIVSTALLSVVAYAQNQDNPDLLFQNYITKNKFYMSQIALKADRVFKLTYPTCDGQIQTTRLKPIVIIPRIFSQELTNEDKEELPKYEFSNIHPSKGQWVERAILNSCGKATQINLLVTAYDLHKVPEIYPLINGQTKVDIIDQSKAEDIVKTEVKSASKCQSNSFVIGTNFMGYRDPESRATLSRIDKNAGWVEQWIVNACDKDSIVNLAVLPDPKTRYRYVAKIKGN